MQVIIKFTDYADITAIIMGVVRENVLTIFMT